MNYVIIDGRNLLWRAASVAQFLTTKVGKKLEHTGGVYGFLNSVLKIHKTYGGKVVVAWEGNAENFRKTLYPEYKKRPKPDKEMKQFLKSLDDQQLKLRRILRRCGVDQYTGYKVEADDVVGTLARKFRKKGKVVIYSNDSDLRQLVGRRVTVVAAGHSGKDIVYDWEKVIEKDGVEPKLIPDLKALMGDSSDNIPGLKGVGPKTAKQMIDHYGRIRSIIKAAKSKNKRKWDLTPRFRDIVRKGEDELQLFLQLTMIDQRAKLRVLRGSADRKILWRLLKKYDFKSLVTKMDGLVRLGGDYG